MGEFEHIKPLIIRLSQQFDVNIIVTFFSPSAYEVVKEFEGVSLFLYLPFDTPGKWRRIYDLLNPLLIVISKHDVWPNQVWVAADKSIPVYLINASLSDQSGRIGFWGRFLLEDVYNDLRGIYTISEEDRRRFEYYFHGLTLKNVGDTKFDQVLIRKELALKNSPLPKEWSNNSMVIVLGSVWPEDTEHTLPVLCKLLADREDLKIIIVPHQPNERFIMQIRLAFPSLDTIDYTHRKYLKDERIIIVDVIGVLADLYRYADIAYVGGSFRQGIHNVMEPAVYRIPVIYGPLYTNSFEAVRLNKAGGSEIVKNSAEFDGVLNRLLDNQETRRQMGEKAGDYAMNNIGATERIINEWKPLLKSD
jgi:3-deoxy-D-manno-octulosonic-acid transferase